MWGALIIIAVASCNGALHKIKTADLPKTAHNRAMGGSDTTIENYPYAVQVWFNNLSYSGGCLVTARDVLSIAINFVDKNGQLKPASNYTVRASTTTLKSGGTVHSVTEIKLHELFNFTMDDNNVAMILMDPPVDFTTSIARPALLPVHNSVFPDNSSVTSIGWGRTEAAAGSRPNFLKEVTMPKINWSSCRARSEWHVSGNMICAGILDVGDKGPCRGDYEGLLIYQGKVMGLALTGKCKSGITLYVRVASYAKWINNVIHDSMQNETDNNTNPGNTGSLSSKVGAITLLTPLLYIILSVYLLRADR